MDTTDTMEPHNSTTPSQLTDPPSTDVAEGNEFDRWAEVEFDSVDRLLRWQIGNNGNMVTCITCPFEQWTRAQNPGHPWVPGAEVTALREAHRKTHGAPPK